MSPRFKATNEVAIVGYAHSAVARHSPTPLGTLTVDTALAAIADAGLTNDQIDGFTTGALLPSGGGQASIDGVSVVTSNWLAEHLGINPRFASGFQGHGQIPGAVMLATNAIVTGAADYVLLHRALHNPPSRYHAKQIAEAPGATQWTVPQGFASPLATIALPYNEYMQRYGATREEMATVVVEARHNGARIPWSFWHNKPLTVDEYMSARLIADPVCIYDCDIPLDGAAAFIFTSAERARDLPHAPVYVSGYAQGHPSRSRLPMHWPLDDIMDTGLELARRLWEHSGLTRDDIDVPQMYDGFSPFVYFWLESLGYCGLGEAHEWVQGGTISSETGLPILSGGGALGMGRMHGVPQMLECYLQLSQRAGERQLARANAGIACHSSPHFGGAVLYSAAR